jgi:ribulose-phosphate 3-epimerase
MKIEIIPAILPHDYSDLEEKISLINGAVKWVQIDVCDGQFVPQPSWPYRKHDDFFDKLTTEQEGLPGWDTLDFEIDLMVNRAEEEVENWISAGASRLIFHIESKTNFDKAFELAADRAEVGLALNGDTDIETLRPYADKISVVQCMGIKNIGFQGQAFDPAVLTQIAKVKKAFPHLKVSVDGHVTMDIGRSLIDAGAERLIVGHAIFEADNPFDAIKEFKALNKPVK